MPEIMIKNARNNGKNALKTWLKKDFVKIVVYFTPISPPRSKVSKFVYTSSASIMFDGTDQADYDELHALPVTPVDAYTHSKLLAERTVLDANNELLYTCGKGVVGL